MEYWLLGPLEVFSNGRALAVGGHKQRALLAVLLLDPNHVVSTNRLIDALWEDEPPRTAGKALQVYVSELRKQLGKERVQTKARGYVLMVEEGELDLERFQRLHTEGRHAEALSLWRGPPLGEFAFERFAQPEIARLQELRLVCLEDRIEADLASGRHAELVGDLEALVKEHPGRGWAESRPLAARADACVLRGVQRGRGSFPRSASFCTNPGSSDGRERAETLDCSCRFRCPQ